MNYFDHSTAAGRYERGRPYIHPLVIAKIAARLGLTRPLDVALDAGCGTGQSATALLALAREVVAIDLSSEMLARAPRDEAGLHFVRARAERVPLRDGSCPLITAGMAYHWFDRARFFEEAARLLGPDGTLAIYNISFLGKIKNNPEFRLWMREAYRKRYPPPARKRFSLSPAGAGPFGLQLTKHETFTSEIWLTLEELVAYLTTQSNVIAKVEHGEETLEEAERWLRISLAPFYRARRENCVFRGEIWYLRA